MNDFIRFSLVNPELLKDGKSVEQATVTAAGAIIHGLYIGMTERANADPKVMAKALKNLIFDIALKGNRKYRYLEKLSTEAGQIVYYNCSICGYGLDLTKCSNPDHKVKYKKNYDLVGAVNARLPSNVVEFFKKQGHTFDMNPPVY